MWQTYISIQSCKKLILRVDQYIFLKITWWISCLGLLGSKNPTMMSFNLQNNIFYKILQWQLLSIFESNISQIASLLKILNKSGDLKFADVSKMQSNVKEKIFYIKILQYLEENTCVWVSLTKFKRDSNTCGFLWLKWNF